MNRQLQPLPVVELHAAGAATRVMRYLSVLLAGVAIPFVIVLATPLVGGMWLAAIVLSPLLLVYVLLVAWRHVEKERRLAAP